MSENLSSNSLAVCHECDWVAAVPHLSWGEAAQCPRCNHKLVQRQHVGTQAEIAWGLGALLALVVALSFEFVSFETSGISHRIVFVDTALALFNYDYVVLGALVFTTTVLLPAIYLSIILYLDIGLALGREFPGTGALASLLRPIAPWIMSDVFIIGVLVSLVKIVTLADIHIGPSFFAFCAYAMLMLRAIAGFDPELLWDKIAGPSHPPQGARAGYTAQEQGITDCNACGALFEFAQGQPCPRCGRKHHEFNLGRLQVTWALLLTSAVLMVPANVLPILRTTSLGTTDAQTIVGGAWYLAQHGSLPIAIIIFVASIVVPIIKIIALAWLCLKAQSQEVENHHEKMQLYRLTELIGRWSMIDVYVVAVLASLVQAGFFMTISPGPAALYFAGVVIATMIAAMTFDTRLLWQNRGQPTINLRLPGHWRPALQHKAEDVP